MKYITHEDGTKVIFQDLYSPRGKIYAFPEDGVLASMEISHYLTSDLAKIKATVRHVDRWNRLFVVAEISAKDYINRHQYWIDVAAKANQTNYSRTVFNFEQFEVNNPTICLASEKARTVVSWDSFVDGTEVMFKGNFYRAYKSKHTENAFKLVGDSGTEVADIGEIDI